METGSLGYRVVFGFFEGQFSLDELDRFMRDLADCTGTAPVAGDYFKTYNADSRVSTGGISFQKNMHVPNRIQDIMGSSTKSNLSMNCPSKLSKLNGLCR